MYAVPAFSPASPASRLYISVFLCLLCASQARIFGGLSLHHRVRVTIPSPSRSPTQPIASPSPTHIANRPSISGPCPTLSSFLTRYIHSAAGGYLSSYINRQRSGPNIPGPGPVTAPPAQQNNPTAAPAGGVTPPPTPVNQVPTSPAPSPITSPGAGSTPFFGQKVELEKCRFGLRRMLGFLLFELLVECAYVVIKFLVSSDRIGLELRHLVIIRAAYALIVFPFGVGILFFGPGQNHDCLRSHPAVQLGFTLLIFYTMYAILHVLVLNFELRDEDEETDYTGYSVDSYSDSRRRRRRYRGDGSDDSSPYPPTGRLSSGYSDRGGLLSKVKKIVVG